MLTRQIIRRAIHEGALPRTFQVSPAITVQNRRLKPRIAFTHQGEHRLSDRRCGALIFGPTCVTGPPLHNPRGGRRVGQCRYRDRAFRMAHEHDWDVPKSRYRCDPTLSIAQLILPPPQHSPVKAGDALGRIATHRFCQARETVRRHQDVACPGEKAACLPGDLAQSVTSMSIRINAVGRDFCPARYVSSPAISSHS